MPRASKHLTLLAVLLLFLPNLASAEFSDFNVALGASRAIENFITVSNKNPYQYSPTEVADFRGKFGGESQAISPFVSIFGPDRFFGGSSGAYSFGYRFSTFFFRMGESRQCLSFETSCITSDATGTTVDVTSIGIIPQVFLSVVGKKGDDMSFQFGFGPSLNYNRIEGSMRIAKQGSEVTSSDPKEDISTRGFGYGIDQFIEVTIKSLLFTYNISSAEHIGKGHHFKMESKTFRLAYVFGF